MILATFLAAAAALGFAAFTARQVIDIKTALTAEIERCRAGEQEQRIQARMPTLENCL